jgi:fermentation-respiration switch protein FrsA (DUF1100 family)
MMGSAKAHYDGIGAFSQTDFTEDLKKIALPVLVMHGDDDQIVPYADSGPLSAKLLKNGTLKTYEGFPHGMPTTQADVINADLLGFIEKLGEPCRSHVGRHQLQQRRDSGGRGRTEDDLPARVPDGTAGHPPDARRALRSDAGGVAAGVDAGRRAHAPRLHVPPRELGAGRASDRI